MRRVMLLGLTLMVGLTLAAALAGSAMAEAAGSLILVLEKEKVSELTYSGTSIAGNKPSIEDTGGKTIPCGEATVKATFEEETGKPLDSETGHALLNFTGCKEGATGCRSETVTEKDPLETILVPVGLIGYAEETLPAKELEFGLATLVTLEGTALKLVCGVARFEEKGTFGCLVGPASQILTEVEGKPFTITCAQEKGKQKNGDCLKSTKACEDLVKLLLGSLNGKEFTDVGLAFVISGTFNKMVFLDD